MTDAPEQRDVRTSSSQRGTRVILIMIAASIMIAIVVHVVVPSIVNQADVVLAHQRDVDALYVWIDESKSLIAENPSAISISDIDGLQLLDEKNATLVFDGTDEVETPRCVATGRFQARTRGAFWYLESDLKIFIREYEYRDGTRCLMTYTKGTTFQGAGPTTFGRIWPAVIAASYVLLVYSVLGGLYLLIRWLRSRRRPRPFAKAQYDE